MERNTNWLRREYHTPGLQGKGILFALVVALFGFGSCSPNTGDLLPELILLDSMKPPLYNISGTFDGFLGLELRIENNVSHTQPLRGDDYNEIIEYMNPTGNWETAPGLYTGDLYSLSIKDYPHDPSQLCTFSESEGQIENANKTGIVVTCEDAFAISGSVDSTVNDGLLGSGLAIDLSDSSGIVDNLSISPGTTSYQFTTPVRCSDTATVTFSGQPTNPWQTCSFQTGGASANAPPTCGSIVDLGDPIICSTNTYSVTLNMSNVSYTGNLVYLNGADETAVAVGNSSVTFPTLIKSNNSYNVTVVPRAGESCAIVNGSGTITNSNVTASMSCSAIGYVIGGSVIGAAGSGVPLELTINGTVTETMSALTGTFFFDSAMANGDNYSVAITADPSGYVCTFPGSVTTVSGGPVTGSVTLPDITCTTDNRFGFAIFGIAIF